MLFKIDVRAQLSNLLEHVTPEVLFVFAPFDKLKALDNVLFCA